MNLDIEGTKHEKVIIIVLAYVIGFTAGFICFGVTQGMRHDRSEKFVMNTHVESPVEVAPTVARVDEVSATPVAVVQNGSVSVTYTDGRLKVQSRDNEYLLSMKSTGLDSAALSAFKNQGIHTDIPMYVASPDGKFVYFCEQQSTTDSCNNFIFDVAKNLIEYVTVDGKKLTTAASVAKTATWSEKGLTVGSNTSAAATAPSTLLTN